MHVFFIDLIKIIYTHYLACFQSLINRTKQKYKVEVISEK